MKFCGCLILLCGLLPASGAAGNLPDGPYVSTSATAVEEVEPDYAVIDLQFRVVEDSPDAARAATNQAQQRLVGLLEDYTEALRDHRLESMQFGEQYEYDRNRQQRVRVGFSGTFSFRLEVDDFDALGKLHYQLAGLEWQSLGNPAFKVADDQAVQTLARQRALEKAGERARSLAEAQGARLGKVWGIIYEPMHDLAGRSPGVIGDAQVRPSAIRMSMAESEFELPVEPRPVRYEATVGVVYTLETDPE